MLLSDPTQARSRTRLPRAALVCVLLAISGSPEAWARSGAPPNRAVVRMAKEAHNAHQAGDQKRAADLYFRAHQLDPGDGAFLWGSARSLQLDGQLELAEVRFVAFLQLETADKALREKAVVYLAEVRAEMQRQRALQPLPADPGVTPTVEAQPATPTVAPAPVLEIPADRPDQPTLARPVVPAAPAPRSALRQGLFWGATGVAAVGAALLGVATWERANFTAAMAPGFSGQAVQGYEDRAAALRAADAISLRQNIGGIVCAAGAVGALAVWFWPRDGADPAVNVLAVPSAQGWAVVTRAQW